mmetsp:Transcript_86144/g.257077  ORF Transcript_86144/g.257077 Transcript_86144/m.257077 type:complete len:271 (+) Transcript_86144:110-922(+)
MVVGSGGEQLVRGTPTNSVDRLGMPLKPLQLTPVASVPDVDAMVLATARHDVVIGPGIRVQDERGLRGREGKVPSVNAQRCEALGLQDQELDGGAQRRSSLTRLGAGPDARSCVDQQQASVWSPTHAEHCPRRQGVDAQRDAQRLVRPGIDLGQLKEDHRVALDRARACKGSHQPGRLSRRGRFRTVAVVVRGEAQGQPQPHGRRRRLRVGRTAWRGRPVDLHLLHARSKEVAAAAGEDRPGPVRGGPPDGRRVDVEGDREHLHDADTRV